MKDKINSIYDHKRQRLEQSGRLSPQSYFNDNRDEWRSESGDSTGGPATPEDETVAAARDLTDMSEHSLILGKRSNRMRGSPKRG